MAKSRHIIKLRKDSEFTSILTIKEYKGYLKFYYNKKEITDHDFMHNFSKEVIDHYTKQADLICRFENAILWSY